MSKRFSETDKWKDTWFRKLSPIEKLVFLYFVDNCNNAGFIELDAEFAGYQIGITENEVLGAIKGLSRGLVGADGWLWIKNFLRHQKNDILNIENNAHRQIISLVKEQADRFSSVACFSQFLGANEGLFSPIGKGKGKGKGKKGETEGEHLPVFDFDFLWEQYPNKDGRKDAERHFKASVKTEEEYQAIQTALKNYLASKKVKEGYVKNGSTWFNNWQDWVVYQELKFGEPPDQKHSPVPEFYSLLTPEEQAGCQAITQGEWTAEKQRNFIKNFIEGRERRAKERAETEKKLAQKQAEWEARQAARGIKPTEPPPIQPGELVL